MLERHQQADPTLLIPERSSVEPFLILEAFGGSGASRMQLQLRNRRMARRARLDTLERFFLGCVRFSHLLRLRLVLGEEAAFVTTVGRWEIEKFI